MVSAPAWLKAWAVEAGISWRGLRGPERLELSRPATRWALARAGGCAGETAEVVGTFDDVHVITGELRTMAVHGFVDTRRESRACKRGIGTCLRLGCDVQGACLATMLQ